MNWLITSPAQAISRKPTFAAAPIRPASMGRDLLGQISITSATPSDHSPPMPSAASSRSPKICAGDSANPQAPEKMA